MDFLVQDVDEAHQMLSSKSVPFLQEPHDTAWGGWIALFAGPEGNTLQLVQIDWPKRSAAYAPSE